MARAILSVAFEKDDFDRLDVAAEKLGVRISAYVRAVALASLEQRRTETHSAATFYAPSPKFTETA